MHLCRAPVKSGKGAGGDPAPLGFGVSICWHHLVPTGSKSENERYRRTVSRMVSSATGG